MVHFCYHSNNYKTKRLNELMNVAPHNDIEMTSCPLQYRFIFSPVFALFLYSFFCYFKLYQCVYGTMLCDDFILCPSTGYPSNCLLVFRYLTSHLHRIAKQIKKAVQGEGKLPPMPHAPPHPHSFSSKPNLITGTAVRSHGKDTHIVPAFFF